MHKIILVIDNPSEKDFLARLLRKLGFNVLSATKTQGVGDQLAEFIPDIVFASMIGKQSNTLNALAKIKASRGVPKVVFVRSENENSPLTPDQKQIVDGLLSSPIDPFNLLDVLTAQLGLDSEELKARYRKLTSKENKGSSDLGQLLIFDQERKDRYAQILKGIGSSNEDHAEFDVQKFRRLKKAQAEAFEEDQEQAARKKGFIKTLFTAPKTVSPDSD